MSLRKILEKESVNPLIAANFKFSNGGRSMCIFPSEKFDASVGDLMFPETSQRMLDFWTRSGHHRKNKLSKDVDDRSEEEAVANKITSILFFPEAQQPILAYLKCSNLCICLLPRCLWLFFRQFDESDMDILCCAGAFQFELRLMFRPRLLQLLSRMLDWNLVMWTFPTGKNP